MEKQLAARLEMKRISIAFPGVQALSGVDFAAEGGRAHALIGANGAGKSTLMKVLAGAYGHYTGTIHIDGQEAPIRTPKDAKRHGVQIVYQEVDTALIPNLTVAENIMLERTVHDMKGRQWINWGELHRSAQAVLERMNVQVPTRKLVQELTLAEKQMVLIARSMTLDCRFLVLDEPTAPLSQAETEQLFKLVRLLKAEGVGVIFISHRLPELYEICEDITIMRDGKLVVRDEIARIPQPKVVEHMLGAKLDGQFPQAERTVGDIGFEAKNITDPGKVDGVNLAVRAGEIIGLAGLVGAGKTELCRALFGASPSATGDIIVRGRKLRVGSPHDAVRGGLALVPEERRREGVFVGESVGDNLTAAVLSRFAAWGSWLSRKKEKAAAAEMIASLGIKTPSERSLVRNLSGGNQQKVAIGKWLLADADVYIFDEPTKGVDVGAKRDIYELVAGLAARGKCVLYASSELPELLGLTDRMYVMYDGTIRKELVTKDTSEEEILLYSTGGMAK
ncbi:sugar ABC transporter ATP-binding protein [Paenibacillus methanolicus]|uniref:Simple sugar transport system ATP-binding protein n=1 Tax=Paenibacillus methanolicus TaxID=582686 RepID=A0A5S5C9X8_9BACL|nr:sugar ABC transporter ATP-binding protein [Paenibacillus methanolicus]TYP74793.1 simple sugar transport system ATP-binding protein [Paenibacillus methanolicus]